MIIQYLECRSKIRVDSSALCVQGYAACCDKSAYTWLHASSGWGAEIVRGQGINPELVSGVVPSANVESASDVPKSLRLQMLDKDKQDPNEQMASSPRKCLLPEQPVPYKSKS